MIKRLLARSAPDLYARLRDFRWETEAWINERWLQEPHPEKKTEWDLDRLLVGLDKKPVDPAQPKILLLAVQGWPYHLLCEALIAARLRLRGSHVEFVLCERDVPFCNIQNAYKGTDFPCDYCVKKKHALLTKHFPTRPIGPLSEACRAAQGEVAMLSLEACRTYAWNGLPLASLCEPTLMWFQCRAFIEEADLPLYRRLLQAGLAVADGFDRHLDRVKPDCAVIFNGDFFAERIARELCARKGIRYVSHELGYLPDTLSITRNAPAAGMFIDDTWAAVEHIALTTEQQKKIRTFFEERRKGPIGIGGKVFWPSIESDAAAIRKELHLDDRPIALAFSNVTWDTAALGREVVFPSLIEWLERTVKFFERHPEWLFVIRCHPSEVRDKGRESRDRVELLLPERVGKLPENVRLVPSGSVMSSYTLMEMARCGIVYTTTAGLEMAAAGKPVVVVARTHYRGKGFTFDPGTEVEYEDVISRLMSSPVLLDARQGEQLLRYAYHFFYERMVSIDPLHLVPGKGLSVLRRPSRLKLARGGYPGLEVICETIARNRPAVTGGRGNPS
jgi:hypothetical protein